MAIGLGILVLGVAGVAAAGAFFSSRDDATLGQEKGPGVARGAGAGPRVTPGNVLLLYGDARLEVPLRELATELAGPADSALEAAGQAVL
ncbi:MAG: hypothetical protein H0T43_06030, partial [Solirubrobacterales bacterium]|nr:hypothetical protein [Solirubrobacterales bacterium]